MGTFNPYRSLGISFLTPKESRNFPGQIRGFDVFLSTKAALVINIRPSTWNTACDPISNKYMKTKFLLSLIGAAISYAVCTVELLPINRNRPRLPLEQQAQTYGFQSRLMVPQLHSGSSD